MYNFPKCEASETWTLKMFLILFVRNSRKTKCTQLIISFIYDTVTITLQGKIVMVKSGFMMNYLAPRLELPLQYLERINVSVARLS